MEAGSAAWRAAVGVAAAAALAVPAAAAGVTTVAYDPATGLRVTADAGDEKLIVASGPDRFLVRERLLSTTFTAGPGCRAVDRGVDCDVPAGRSRFVVVTLGEGRDSLEMVRTDPALPPFDALVEAGGGPDFVDGGPGADLIRGGAGDDTLAGEAVGDAAAGQGGADVIEGGPGADTLLGDLPGRDTFRGGDGDDLFRASRAARPGDSVDGGPGTDTADYAARLGPVTLTVSSDGGGTADDGAAGEADTLAGVERLIGGAGGDLLRADGPVLRTPPRSVFTLRGNAGDDDLRVTGVLTTSLDGGVGRDTVRGGGGRDTVFSREGEADLLSCGGAVDTLTPDLRDSFSADCEVLDQSDRREDPNVVVLTTVARVDRAGRTSVRLRCPAATRIGCRGVLSVRLDGARRPFGPPARYALRRGRTGAVTVAVPPWQVAAARRPGAVVRVRSIEAGVRGPKTTQRLLPVRPR